MTGFYRGVPPHLLVQCASQTSYYGSYGVCLRFLGSDRDSKQPIPLWHNFLAGSFGGFVQSFPSSVLEMLKIRLQTSSESFKDSVKKILVELDSSLFSS